MGDRSKVLEGQAAQLSALGAMERGERRHRRRPPGSWGRCSFWLGVILMVLSFGIYPAYSVVPFLRISRWSQGGVVIAMSVVSWAMFFVGTVLAGQEGVAYVKRRFSWRKGA